MEPPLPDAPPPPQAPFDPAARPKTSGCPKPLIIGCIAILLIGGLALLGGLYFMMKNASRVLQWSLNQTEKELMTQLPKEVTPEERDRLHRAFADVIQGIRDERIPIERLQPVQFKMLEIARKGSSVTRQDVLELTRQLEAAAGKKEGQPQSGTPPATT